MTNINKNLYKTILSYAVKTACAAILCAGAFAVVASAAEVKFDSAAAKALGTESTAAISVPAPVQSAAAQPLHAEAPVYFDFNPQDVPKYDAVVVTVCGLSFAELKTALLKRIFSGDKTRMAKAMTKLDALETPATRAEVASKLDDAYLEHAMQTMLGNADKKYLVVPLRWTRNPDKTTEAEANFMVWLPKVAAVAAANHKPLYIFCHSWGTILTHDVLTMLAKNGSQVHVDKLVTIGSPLVPGSWWLKTFEGLEKPSNNFAAQAVKPRNVDSWTNFWASRDLFSNTIQTADKNLQVDEAANPLAKLIDTALFNPVSYALATVDFLTINSLSQWHASYYAGYQHFFSSVGQTLDLDIPNKTVMPNSF